MFAYLEGTVDSVDERSAVIDVGGIGFRVQAPAPVLAALRPERGRVRVHTHLAVREDGWSLYGFLDPRDREVFRALIGVTKVGPALALKVLSVVPVDELVRAVRGEDEAVLTRVPGIGAKSARRLVLELRDRFAGLGTTPGAPEGVGPQDAASDAVAALVALGFGTREAQEAVGTARAEAPEGDLQGLIRGALAQLRRG
ncbi:MAG TPA: Holliday junction branch migration protein RuvA [Methanoregulaceae archaeon]|nr:Holliday junction branch migration protein RuvA [Methanoregulaceae archaeon]HQJ87818.1 Holliday junction branch migration protein RuvA [Methanoregulaceae archaeon]